ncbi:MAG: fused MFS/spermidine synthase [Thermoguttaceae bacterium]
MRLPMTAPAPKPSAADRWAMMTFVAVTLLGALLLFLVQPLISKAILPWFGGCPAVWTTCLLFFQTLLFAGYLYAHLLQRWCSPRRQAAVHLAIAVAAMALLPIGPTAGWRPTDDSLPSLRILWLLLATVGLPYFALSATSPLVQTWFSVRRPGRSPYRLYAVSNFGSLAALLCYPIVFEPAFDLPAQSRLWSGAFAFYAVLCAAILLGLVRDPAAGVSPASLQPSGDVPAVRWRDRMSWLALPALASWMLVAGTNHLCQDVAVVPFLWVLPLTLYLLSFIICFDHARWYVRWLWAVAAAVELIGVAACDHLKNTLQPLPLAEELILNGAAIFFVCMVCHGELARRKPDARRLTEFYLIIAAGGALGGLLVGLVAPLVFSSYWEWPIGMVLSVLLAIALLTWPGPGGKKLLIRMATASIFAAAGLGVVLHWELQWERTLDRARNFFGVVSVTESDRDDPAEHVLYLKHGRIVHGCQFTDPVKRRWPTVYYGADSGVDRAVGYSQRRGPIRIGAIGLGIGTVAAYARPGDAIRFYEINPEVIRLARDRFRYLADCRGRCEIVPGDARLSLEREPPQRFDILVVDAFSGDAIPTHLLTREAFELYRRHLAPDGILAIHVSNNYLRLGPVVRRAAESCGLKSTQVSGKKNHNRRTEFSTWVLVTSNDDFLRRHPSEAPADASAPLWTDQYSNLFQILAARPGEGE